MYIADQCLSLAGAATSIIFVVTNTCLSQENMFCYEKCRDKTGLLLQQKYACRDKTFAVFVTTKMILVAAPAMDKCQRY